MLMQKFTKNSFVRNLAKGKLLVPFLEQYAEYDKPFEFKYKPKEDDDAWHPSGDCMPSVMDLYYKVTQPGVEVHSPGLQKAFLVGHFWHQVLQNVLVDLGFAKPFAIERKGAEFWGPSLESIIPKDWPWPQYSKPYHWACGSGDVAPLELPSDWVGILDIKTMRAGDFKPASTSGLLPARFRDKYEAQINMYMDFFDQSHGMILAVNKDSPHDCCEFVFDRNDELIATIYEKWQYVSECLDEGHPPLEGADEVFQLPFTGPVS
jgi:hypothetical protein